jgi:hypothetical protein
MKITSVIARFLLGLIFLVFGLQWLPPLHSQFSAVWNGWPVRRGALCLSLSGPDISAPNHFGGAAPD